MNTNYFLNCAAGNLFRTKQTPAIPSKYYIGLSTSAPNADGTGANEPSASAGYARVELTSLSEPTDGVVTNTLPISFDESSTSWGTVTHFVIYDSGTAGSGNLLMYGELTSPRSVEAATIMTIKAGYLKLFVQNGMMQNIV